MLTRWQSSRPTAMRLHSFIPSLRPELGPGPVCCSKQNFHQDSIATMANYLLGSSTRNPSPSTSASFPTHHHKSISSQPSSISATIAAIAHYAIPSAGQLRGSPLGETMPPSLPIKMFVWLFFHV